jgi:hypothetical protein
LGLPPEYRSLSPAQKVSIKEARMKEVDDFFQKMKQEILKADNDTLKNIRINSTLAIAAYNKIKDKLNANPHLDKEFVEKNMKEHIRVRELAIDEMINRGLPLFNLFSGFQNKADIQSGFVVRNLGGFKVFANFHGIKLGFGKIPIVKNQML